MGRRTVGAWGGGGIRNGPGGALLGPLLSAPFVQGYKVNSTLTGGRVLNGGAVRKVTTLADSGAGSLRAALTDGPADIVFEVGGQIQIDSYLAFPQNLTIHGETAPSPGITIIDHTNTSVAANALWGFQQDGLDPVAANLVIRHLRVRQRADHTTLDCSNVYVGNGSNLILFDHCSFAYNSDEGVAYLGNGEHDCTHFACFFGPGAYGVCKNMLIGGGNPSTDDRIALIQGFWGLALDRNPEQKPGVSVALYNNYIYACGNGDNSGVCENGFYAVTTSDGTHNPVTHVSMRGNRYESNSSYNRPQYAFHSTIDSTGHESYFADNMGIVRCVYSGATVNAVANETDLSMTLPEVGPALVQASSGIKAYVLANSGARPLDRDQVDTDLVTAANTGTGTQNMSNPPAYSLGTGSLAMSIPGDWNAQAPGEATGWRKLDVLCEQRAHLVGAY